MDKKTKVFIETYKGHEIIAIWAVDPCGNKTGKFPVISFGLKKAEAVVTHLEEIRKIVGK